MKFFLLFALVSVAAISGAQEAPEVQLKSGKAKAVRELTPELKTPLNVFYGIPFAEPPVGKLRFMAPVPYKGAEDQVLTSDKFRSSCVNVPASAGLNDVSEDCLHLNVFAPVDASPDKLKKVFIFVHGGAFFSGSASYYIPTEMVTRHDFIAVTLQYRLSGFGFLSSGDDAVTGNMALRDMLMAIQWVKDNIKQFGGDPNDITLDGSSAGAMAVSALSIVPQAKDLFQKVIMQSGTVYSSMAVSMDPEPTFRAFAEKAGCLPADQKDVKGLASNKRLLECLQQLTVKEVMDAHPVTPVKFSKPVGDQMTFRITGIDKELFPEPPRQLMRNKKYLEDNGVLNRKYMNGVVDNEGLLAAVFLMSSGDPKIELIKPEVVNSLIQAIMGRHTSSAVPQEFIDRAMSVYTEPKVDGKTPFQKILELQDDDLFTLPNLMFTNDIIEASPSTPVYLFLFNAESIPNDPKGYTGTMHTMELVHEFDETPSVAGVFFHASKDPAKFTVIRDKFRQYISDFVKTGNPSSSTSVAWPMYDLDEKQYLYITSEPVVKKCMHKERYSLWIDFFKSLRA